jgi:hypothetical protein
MACQLHTAQQSRMHSGQLSQQCHGGLMRLAVHQLLLLLVPMLMQVYLRRCCMRPQRRRRR